MAVPVYVSVTVKLPPPFNASVPPPLTVAVKVAVPAASAIGVVGAGLNVARSASVMVVDAEVVPVLPYVNPVIAPTIVSSPSSNPSFVEVIITVPTVAHYRL